MTTEQNNEEPLIFAKDVALILGCSDETVRKLAKAKRLRAVSLSPRGTRENFRFKRSWVDEFLERESKLPEGEDDQLKSATKEVERKSKSQSTNATIVPMKRHSIMNIGG